MELGDFDEAKQADFQAVRPQFDLLPHQVQIAIEAEDKWAQGVALGALPTIWCECETWPCRSGALSRGPTCVSSIELNPEITKVPKIKPFDILHDEQRKEKTRCESILQQPARGTVKGIRVATVAYSPTWKSLDLSYGTRQIDFANRRLLGRITKRR